MTSQATQHAQGSAAKYAIPLAIQPTELELTARAQSTEPLFSLASKGTQDENYKEDISVSANEVNTEDSRSRLGARGGLRSMEEEGVYPFLASSEASARTTLSMPISMNSVQRQYQSVDRMSGDYARMPYSLQDYARTTPRGVDVIEHRDQLLRGNAFTRLEADRVLLDTIADVEAQK